MTKEAFEKISWCIGDINEFVDLIEINDSSTGLGKRYKLWKNIAGGKIVNRIQNLIIACWSAKDAIMKKIAQDIGEKEAKEFEKELFANESAELIQYLANSFKHAGIDKGKMEKNRFKATEPKLEKTFVHLVNNSFPGRLKPTFYLAGTDVPAFHIEQVCATINGEAHYNFDTIILSVKITDKDNKPISHVMAEVDKYVHFISEKCKNLGL